MKTNSIKSNSQSAKDLDKELNKLIADAKTVKKESGSVYKEVGHKMDGINARTDKSINNLVKIYSDLDKIEKKAGDDFDNLALEQSEDLATE